MIVLSQRREKIEEKSLTITKEEHFVTFGCLTTTKEYCQTVIKNINRIKMGNPVGVKSVMREVLFLSMSRSKKREIYSGNV